MQGKHLYEYAVIRFVPRVEREEFINVGIILFSKRTKFIKARYLVDEKRQLFFLLNWIWIRCMPVSGCSIISAPARKKEGRLQHWIFRSRFRWLTAVRSSSLQTSRPHPGFSSDLEATFEQLFTELVL
ncbi:MAG: DUF3037 domain-containing protein [Parabacteroides sp.]|nr:DUF3037 domain-containing protein [Parabacteroides sp.]